MTVIRVSTTGPHKGAPGPGEGQALLGGNPGFFAATTAVSNYSTGAQQLAAATNGYYLDENGDVTDEVTNTIVWTNANNATVGYQTTNEFGVVTTDATGTVVNLQALPSAPAEPGDGGPASGLTSFTAGNPTSAGQLASVQLVSNTADNSDGPPPLPGASKTLPYAGGANPRILDNGVLDVQPPIQDLEQQSALDIDSQHSRSGVFSPSNAPSGLDTFWGTLAAEIGSLGISTLLDLEPFSGSQEGNTSRDPSMSLSVQPTSTLGEIEEDLSGFAKGALEALTFTEIIGPPNSPQFEHWRAAGQVVGGSIEVLIGGGLAGAGSIGGLLSTPTGVGPLAGAGIAEGGLALAAGGLANIGRGFAHHSAGEALQSRGGSGRPKSSAGGPRAGEWGEPSRLKDHFNEHVVVEGLPPELGVTTVDEYVTAAAQFLDEAEAMGYEIKVDPMTGETLVYDPETGLFGAYNSDGSMKSFYKLDPAVHFQPTNDDYFDQQRGIRID